MEIEIVHGFTKHEAGDIVKVETVAKGVPKDVYWRRRIRDAKIDGCIKIVGPVKKNSKAKAVKADEGTE